MEQDNSFQVESAFDAVGSLRIGYKNLSAEEMESLKVLNSSPHWAVYRKLLTAAQGEHFRAAMKVGSVDEVVKSIHLNGTAAGLNFAITQLPILCRDYDAKLDKAVAKDSKKPVPFKRG